MAITELSRILGNGAKRGVTVALFGFMLAFLAACGGGGAASSSGSGTGTGTGGTGGGGTGGGGTTTTPTLALSLSDPTTNAVRTAVIAGSPLRVSATIKTAAGVGIAGALVTFTTDIAYGVFQPSSATNAASATALTDANGVASVLLYNSTSTGAATVTANSSVTVAGSTSPTALTGTINYTTTAGTGTITLALLDPATNAVRTSIAPGSPARIVATVKSVTGTPIAGALVDFSTNGAFGVFVPASATSAASGSAVTDAAGVASLLIYNSETGGGSTITAQTSISTVGSTTPTQVSSVLNYTATAGVPSITLSLTDPVSGAVRNTINTTSPARITATVRAASGLPVVGLPVAFATDLPFGAITAGVTSVTDASGVVTATLAASTGSGSSSVRAAASVPRVAGGAATQVGAAVGYTASGATGTPTISVVMTETNSAASRTSVSPGNPARISATFRSATGTPIAGTVITFTTDATLGVFSPASGTALTDVNGVASVTLNASTASGAATVTASGQTTLTGAAAPSTFTGAVSYAATGSTAGSATLDVALAEPLPATDITTFAKSQIAKATAVFKALLAGNWAMATAAFRTITPGSPARVTATFKSPTGAPIVGAVITFATDPTFGVFTPASGTALTDANGVASVTLGSSTSTGAATVTASGQTVLTTGAAPTTITGSASYTVTGSSGGALTLTLAMIDLATTTARTSVSAGNGARVQATLKTSAGAAIPGAVVTFVTDATLGVFTPANGSAITDSTGVATLNLNSSTASGSGVITATTQTVAPGATTASTVTSSLAYSATGSVASLSLALTDPSTGAARTSISSGNPARVTATVRSSSGALASGVVVTFTTDPTLGVFSPTSATALTDSSGVASIILGAATLTSSGATSVTANAQVGAGAASVAVNGSAGYSVGAANVTISTVTIGTPNLSAFGTTSVSVVVSAGGVPTSTPLSVSFSSPCGSNGRAALTPTVTTLGGTATASYRDIGCAGSDTITATVTGLSVSSTGTVVVAPPGVGSIQYVAAAPTSISLRGTGGLGRQETSQVSFRVVDVGGNPLGGRTVSFALNTVVGGISLSTASAISDPTTGLAVTNVQAGNVSTPVRVTATTVGGTTSSPVTLSTQSDQLSITTGVPSQDGFSLSLSTANIEGWNIDGTTTTVTVRLADHFRNPVPDGTAVNFTAEGGSINGSCSVVAGACSVRLTSQNFRPSNGRISLLAYAVGEEAFTDLNGNGWVDTSPTNEMIDPDQRTTDLGEAFVDFNENGVRDATEPFIDFNSNGLFDGPDGRFNGILCDDVNPGRSAAGSCSSTKTIHVRGSSVVVLSGSFPNITIDVASIALAACDTSFKSATFTIQDVNGNAMPSGTTVTFTSTNGKIASTPTSFTIPNTIACMSPGTGGCPASAPDLLTTSGAARFTVLVTSDDVATTTGCVSATRSGQLTATVRTPSGATTTSSITVTD